MSILPLILACRQAGTQDKPQLRINYLINPSYD